MRSNSRHLVIVMTAEGMTSISVSYEVRRQLNTLRTLSGYKSVNEFLNDLVRAHKITKMSGEIDTLRERMKAVADVEVEHLDLCLCIQEVL